MPISTCARALVDDLHYHLDLTFRLNICEENTILVMTVNLLYVTLIVEVLV